MATNPTFGGINDNNKHTAAFRITKASFESTVTPGTFYDGLQLSLTIDGSLTLSGDDKNLGTGTSTFDEVAFGSASGSLDFVLDNVNVTYDVPEPATLSLLLLTVGLCGWRRPR